MEQSKIDIGYGIIAYVNETGQYHNLIGPAVIYPVSEGKEFGANGLQEYYVNGIRHREDGPAVFYPYSSQCMYYKNGKLHREDGPAVINSSGAEEYYVNGIRHREDGPAYIAHDENGNVLEAYYINGKKVDPLEENKEDA